MKKYTLSLLLASLFVLVACQQEKKAAVETPKSASATVKTNQAPSSPVGEWVTLFDGISGAHWRGYGEDGFPENGWTVKNGALTLLDKSKGGTLITKEQYENFDLELEFNLAKGANSGILYLIQEIADKPAYYSAPEYQLIDDAYSIEKAAGEEVVTKHHLTGDNYDLQSAPASKTLYPAGKWNKARILINKGHVEHYLNGEKVVEYTLQSPKWNAMIKESKFADWDYGKSMKGHIGLQDHGNMVSFRNIRIKKL